MRLYPWLGAVVGASLFLAGCGPRETAAARGLRDQVLHAGNGTEPSDLDPQTISGRPESDIVRALSEGLVAYDAQDLHPVPGVAERWEVAADARTYTFHLRADARWSNGDPVTARDFLGSWRRMLTPSLAARYAYMLFVVDGAEEFHRGQLADFAQVGFAAPDDRTVVIRLKQPVSSFLNQLLHYSWYPVHLPTVEKFGGLARSNTPWTRPGNHVGNGPFVLKEWRPNQVVVVGQSPTYWNRAAVRLNEIRFYPVEGQSTEENMFRTGQLHLTNSVPLSALETYRAQQPSPLHIDPMFGTMYIRVNVERPGIADPRVRRALALAIDRVALTTRVNRTGKIPAYNFTPPGAAGFHPQVKLDGTLDEARALLAAAGFPGGRGLGPIEMLFPTSDNGRLIAEAIQERWRAQLGVDVRLVNQEWKVYLTSMDQRHYDLAISVWVGDYLDPTTFLDLMVTGGGNNRTGWGNAEYDGLLRDALAATDPAVRLAEFEKLEAILLRELPVLPVYFYSSVHLRSPVVRGYHPTLLDIHPWQNVWLEETP